MVRNVFYKREIQFMEASSVNRNPCRLLDLETRQIHFIKDVRRSSGVTVVHKQSNESDECMARFLKKSIAQTVYFRIWNALRTFFAVGTAMLRCILN